MLLACSALTANLLATKVAIARLSPNVSPSPMQKRIQTRQRLTIVFLIVGPHFPTSQPTGAAIVVIYWPLDERIAKSAQSVDLHVTPNAHILSRISVECQWKRPISFLWRFKMQGEGHHLNPTSASSN